MINFFDLPEYLQYSLVFINLLILAVNVYCVIISAVFESKKRYRFLNGLVGAHCERHYLEGTSERNEGGEHTDGAVGNAY